MNKLVFSRNIDGHRIDVWFDEKRQSVSINDTGETVAEVRVDEHGVVVYTPATKEDLE